MHLRVEDTCGCAHVSVQVIHCSFLMRCSFLFVPNGEGVRVNEKGNEKSECGMEASGRGGAVQGWTRGVRGYAEGQGGGARMIGGVARGRAGTGREVRARGMKRGEVDKGEGGEGCG